MDLTQAEGVSIVHETVYENRFGFTHALRECVEADRVAFDVVAIDDANGAHAGTGQQGSQGGAGGAASHPRPRARAVPQLHVLFPAMG